jgi:hypothetical protein
MPSGGSTPLGGDDWEYVRKVYGQAVFHGLQYEWLEYFIGGIVNDHKGVKEAANDAAIEWDF